MKAQLSEADYTSGTKHNSCGSQIPKERGRSTRGEMNSFKVWFRSDDNEAVNQVKAKLFKIVQSERSNSNDDVRPDKSEICYIGYNYFLYFVIAWLATYVSSSRLSQLY